MHLNAIKYGSYDSFELTSEAEKMIAKRSFRNPRNAIKLLERCKNYALSKDTNRIDENLVNEYADKRGIDEHGLNNLYREAIKILIREFPREVSTNALVEQLNVAKSDVENNIFPDLVAAGLAKRSPRSWRQATEKAVEKYGSLLDA
jgi:Holliday junction resolvasome RuvABC ATP-dependent DNA helicase subunit